MDFQSWKNRWMTTVVAQRLTTFAAVSTGSIGFRNATSGAHYKSGWDDYQG